MQDFCSVVSPRVLIIVRAGRHSTHSSWLSTVDGLADVALSIYDDSVWPADEVKFIHHARGGKFPGLMAFFEAFPGVIESYDYFWLFEDDLDLPFGSLRRTLDILSVFPFDLAAPSLTHDSFFSWPIAVRNSQFLFRCTNFVEVMAPIMSRVFLRRAMPAFNENYSGWGHEWLWECLLAETKCFAAILDSAPITHGRAFGSGTLYRNCPAGGWTPEEDRDRLFHKYGLDKSVEFRNFFAVSAGKPHKILLGDEFYQHGLPGYAEMRARYSDGVSWCVRTFSNEARPVATLSDLRDKTGFRMVSEVIELLDKQHSHYRDNSL
jgi:hypothetical protein